MSRYISYSLDQARRRAMHLAARQHVSLGTDLTKHVDIFGVMKRQLWVMFQPLGSLYGMYMSMGNAHGIVINSKHPPHLQRFTAAHEYGHFLMEHGPSIDKEEQVLSSARYSNTQEVEAQTFAAHFLMPLQLVNTLLHQMDLPLKPEKLSVRAIYQLSLELGASYTAVINHLVSLKKLDPLAANEFRIKTPKAIKAGIRGGEGPLSRWADVWTLFNRDAGREISIYPDDEIHIYLPETLADDSPWRLPQTIDTNLITLVQSRLEITTSLAWIEQEQSYYVHHFTFRSLSPGSILLRLEKQGIRPEVYELYINCLPRQTQGLLDAQKKLLPHYTVPEMDE